MKETYNLTQGKVYKVLLSFYFPMLFTNVLQQIYTFADTVIVGKGLGDNALAAVGNMSSLSFLVTGFLMGMANGFGVIIGQAYGGNNAERVRKAFAASTTLSLILSVFLTVLSVTFLNKILLIMQTDKIILNDSLKYGFIIFGGLAATMAFNLFSSVLRALGDSKTPFIAILLSSVINILLDLIFIFILHTGVEGAAAATIFSQCVSSVICFLKLRKTIIADLNKDDFKNNRTLNLELLKNGIPMACMNSVTAVGCMIIQGFVNGLGIIYTSAYSAYNRYINLFMLPSVTAGFAVSAFTSQNMGAKKYERIKSGVRTGLAIALISSVLIAAMSIFLSDFLNGIMLNSPETISLASEILKISGSMYFLLNFLFIIRNAVQGMGKPFIPMCSGILEMLVRLITIVLFMPLIGFVSTAYAEVAAWATALLLNIIAYKYYNKNLSA